MASTPLPLTVERAAGDGIGHYDEELHVVFERTLTDDQVTERPACGLLANPGVLVPIRALSGGGFFQMWLYDRLLGIVGTCPPFNPTIELSVPPPIPDGDIDPHGDG